MPRRAERINREVLAVRKRVPGPEHPETLAGAANLAVSLSDQCERMPTRRNSTARLGARHGVAGTGAGGDSAVATWVQRSRPQHAERSSRSSAATARRHGRARAAARRQARAQWQARSLSRLLTHTARITAWCCRSRPSALLHRAGCASEEASSVCSRCQALLVLLPGCQRADW